MFGVWCVRYHSNRAGAHISRGRRAATSKELRLYYSLNRGLRRNLSWHRSWREARGGVSRPRLMEKQNQLSQQEQDKHRTRGKAKVATATTEEYEHKAYAKSAFRNLVACCIYSR